MSHLALGCGTGKAKRVALELTLFGPIQRLIVKTTMLTDKLPDRGGKEIRAAAADVAQR
jgi:hypothetical protein